MWVGGVGCVLIQFFFLNVLYRSSFAIRAVAAAIVTALRHRVAAVAAPSDEWPAPADKAFCHSRPRSMLPSGRVRSGRVPLANVLPLRCACPLGQHRIPEARIELQKSLQAAVSAAKWARYPLATGRGKDTGKAAEGERGEKNPQCQKSRKNHDVLRFLRPAWGGYLPHPTPIPTGGTHRGVQKPEAY